MLRLPMTFIWLLHRKFKYLRFLYHIIEKIIKKAFNKKLYAMSVYDKGLHLFVNSHMKSITNSCRMNSGCVTRESHIYFALFFQKTFIFCVTCRYYYTNKTIYIWVWIFFPAIIISHRSLTAFVPRKNANQKIFFLFEFYE
jgi:hypothetical protein